MIHNKNKVSKINLQKIAWSAF